MQVHQKIIIYLISEESISDMTTISAKIFQLSYYWLTKVNNASDGHRTVFIKAANLRWKNIFHNGDLVMGQMSTPTFATTSEPVWGYRSLEKTIMDMRKIGGSNDVGVSLQGKFNDKGDYGYNLDDQ